MKIILGVFLMWREFVCILRKAFQVAFLEKVCDTWKTFVQNAL